jgi:hypothetical protein
VLWSYPKIIELVVRAANTTAESKTMAAKRVKPPQRELTVVLDTNALYTGSASYFVRREVADLIEQHSSQPDLKLRWIVPEVVRHERQFQMLQEAAQMLPTIERLERLLGHNLNITLDILEMRVQAAVDRQVQQFGITVQPLNVSEVDWQRLMLDAAYRKPPFQLGEKEKGFRDALILETFLQLVAVTPTSPSVARITLVSNDQLLRDSATTRVRSAGNVHVLESIDALKGLINTLGSSVDEQFIEAIRERAGEAFFKAKEESTLYYKASVGASLADILTKATFKLPDSADKYTVEKWTLSPPRFVKKVGQRIHWTTRFEAKLRALKSAPPPQWLSMSPYMLSSTSGQEVLTTSTWSTNQSWPPSSVVISGSGGSEDQLVAYGTASMDVNWSLAVTTSGTLTKLQLESIQFVEVIWG